MKQQQEEKEEKTDEIKIQIIEKVIIRHKYKEELKDYEDIEPIGFPESKKVYDPALIWKAKMDLNLPINSAGEEYPNKHFMDFDFVY